METTVPNAKPRKQFTYQCGTYDRGAMRGANRILNTVPTSKLIALYPIAVSKIGGTDTEVLLQFECDQDINLTEVMPGGFLR